MLFKKFISLVLFLLIVCSAYALPPHTPQQNAGTSASGYVWDQIGIPHKGWRNISSYDATGGDPNEVYHKCEMCGNSKVRFVHVMSHPEYRTNLEVGCECADKMAEDYDAQVEDRRLKNEAARNARQRKQEEEKRVRLVREQERRAEMEREGLAVSHFRALERSDRARFEVELKEKIKRKLPTLWKTKPNGNDSLYLINKSITVFKDKYNPNFFTFVVDGTFSTVKYANREEAKEAAFDKFWELLDANQKTFRAWVWDRNLLSSSDGFKPLKTTDL